jgi:hypothetical protein
LECPTCDPSSMLCRQLAGLPAGRR